MTVTPAPHLPASLTQTPALQRLMALLADAGHQAVIVGGAVRNALLGQAVGDIDIATDARPEAVTSLAAAAGLRALPTGIEHGTVTVLVDGRPFEVTTFRRDVETDGRHARVAFSADPAEDAARRDFTINALYADAAGRVIDPTGLGLADLAARRLRFVGRAEARIAEDYLRVLRFFRFLALYGRAEAADAEALQAAAAAVPHLAKLSRERVGGEVRKLLAAPDPAPAMALMDRAGVLAAVLPDADPAPLAALVAAEAEAAALPDWQRRLALICATDPTAALRLSRPEAARHARLAAAGRARPFSVDAAGFRLGAVDGRDAVLIAAALGASLPDGWSGRLAEAAAAPLPIAAADLEHAIAGPALGRGLKEAQRLWVESGFSMPAPALIDAAILAAKAD